MSTIGIVLNIPAADGVGTASQTNNMQKRKSVTIGGTFVGGVILEAQAAASGPWCQIAQYIAPKDDDIDVVCVALRVRRTGTVSGTPIVNVSAEEGVVNSAALTVPAAAGVGASTNTTAFGEDVTIVVGSPFGGVISVEGSADNTTFQQIGPTFTGPGCVTLKTPANFVRVRRAGSVSGTPLVSYAAASELQAIGLGEIDGLQMTYTSVTEVTLAAGAARDSTGGTIIQSGGALVADITIAGAGGLDTGAEAANTWYNVHLIGGPGVATAALLSLSATAPTLPAGYTVFRRVGVVRNDSGSNFLAFLQRGSDRDREYYTNNLVVLAAGAAEAYTVRRSASVGAGRCHHQRFCKLLAHARHAGVFQL